MTESAIQISIATEHDVADIVALMAANHASNGGSLSIKLSQEQVHALLAATPAIVARRGERVVGFLLTNTRAAGAGVPILHTMLAAYPCADDAYVYGPICVAADARGQGVAQAMCAALQRVLPGREGVLFIRRDNTASLRAHAKMGMREVAGFVFGDAEHAVFSFVG